MHVKRKRAIGVLALLLGPVACSEIEPTQVSAVATRSEYVATSTVSATKQADAELLAKGLAMATNNASVRAHLRTAMRDSRWTDHKLVLQEFALTKQGDVMVRQMAVALGMTPSDIQSLIAGLPAMDFYVPFRSHRLSWKGSPDLTVAASFEPDAPTLTAFGPDGAARTLRRQDGDPGQTLIILHPAEPKGIRAKNDTATSRDAIQSPKEKGATNFLECGDDCGGGGGGGSGGVTPPAPGLYVTQFYSYRDDGWWGSLEMEFRSFGIEGAILYQGNGYWYMDANCQKYTGTANFEPQQDYTGILVPVGPNITNVAAVRCNLAYTPRGYEMYAFESDGGLNGTGDDFGRRFFFGSSAIPFGAAVGYKLPYYSLSGIPNDDGELSVSMTLEYR